MTPRLAQIAFLAFLLAATGVAVNALFLQTRPTIASRAVLERPLPGSTAEPKRKGEAQAVKTAARPTAGSEDAARRSARPVPAAGADAAASEAKPEAAREDSETIRALQRELRQLGYGALVSDGVMRPMMRAAIMAYEDDQGIPLTGEASEELLKRVLLGAAASGDASPSARKVATPQAAQMVRTVQTMLTGLGYQPGPTDGRFGDETERAIREFELDKGMFPAKGRISADLLNRLTESTAQSKAHAAR